MEFEAFSKIPRFSRDIIITEKIDGTNAQVLITEDGQIKAGSRSRYITPENDNHGFAAWVESNKDELIKLGPGRHFGEWWGKGINRGYGLQEKRFSLFNVNRWADRHMGDLTYIGEGAVGAIPKEKQKWAPACCYVVPVLYSGPWVRLEDICSDLANGSYAAPGFMKPEGIVIYHTAGGYLFKKTLEKDEQPKSAQAA